MRVALAGAVPLCLPHVQASVSICGVTRRPPGDDLHATTFRSRSRRVGCHRCLIVIALLDRTSSPTCGPPSVDSRVPHAEGESGFVRVRRRISCLTPLPARRCRVCCPPRLSSTESIPGVAGSVTGCPPVVTSRGYIGILPPVFASVGSPGYDSTVAYGDYPPILIIVRISTSRSTIWYVAQLQRRS